MAEILDALNEPLLVVLGFLFGLLPGMRQRRRQAKGHLATIEAELTHCQEGCEEFARGLVIAPIYRLPITGTSAALAWLIAEGYLEPDEYDATGRVIMLVDQVNRGLDRTADADALRQPDEHARVQVKVGHLLRQRDGGTGKLGLARDALKKARERSKLE